MKQIKKLIVMLLIAALVFTSFGCLASAPAPAESEAPAEAPAKVEEPKEEALAEPAGPSGTVEFWSFYSPGTVQSELYDSIVADFQAAHPEITVNVTYAGQDLITKVRPSLTSQTPPDIIMTNSMVGGTLNAEGVLLPMNDYLAGQDYTGANVWADTLISGTIAANTDAAGNIYGVPAELASTAFFYNKGMFDEKGLAAPTTWDEMIALFDALQADDIAPIVADGNVDFYLAWYFSNLAIREAGRDKYLGALKGEVSWTEPEFVEAAKKLQKLTGYLQKGFQGTQYPAANALLAQGFGATMYVGTWLPQEILTLLPEGYELGLFPFPSLKDGDPIMAEVKTNSLCIPKDAKNPDAAAEFIKYYTSPEVSAKIAATLDTHTATAGCEQPALLAELESMIASADVVTSQYNYLQDEAYVEYAGQVVYPLNSSFMFGDIATAEEFVQKLDEQTKAYYGA